MIFLILAIISSTVNQLLFKAFVRFRIDLLGAIVVNYAVCTAIGYGASIKVIPQNPIFTQNWYLFSIMQGGIFVACLFLMGWTTEKHGVAVASLATRLSVAIPTIAAFLLYDDVATVSKIIGIMAAFMALFLSSADPAKPTQSNTVINILPLSLFIVFGSYSTLLKFVQEKYLNNTSYNLYVMSAFFSAFIISGLVLIWKSFRRQQILEWKCLIGGLFLGCTNYGSVYFLVRALSIPGWQSSQIFPTASIAVVSFSSLGAWLFFGEQFHRRMLIALAIGVGSIVFVNL